MTLNVKLSIDYKNIFKSLLKRFSLVLWVFLALVLIAEGFVLRDSLSKILTATDQSQMAGAQLIRVNFNLYDQIEKRLTENAKFVPEAIVTEDPFGLPPVK